VPVKSIHDFEMEFLHHLEVSHKELLADLKQGKIDDQILAKIDSIAKETAAKYIE
jgi:F-type H+-transporting ATPase subunit alpha